MLRARRRRRTARYRPGGPPHRASSDVDLHRSLEDWQRDGIGYWIVEHHGSVISRAGQRRIDVPDQYLPGVPPERLLHTYYRFTPAVWGRGIAFEAARAALDATLATGSRYPVVAITTPDSVPSQRLALRLGMEFHRRVPVPTLPDTIELRLDETTGRSHPASIR